MNATLERDHLLSTKITIPRVRSDSLARSRLIEALNDGTTRDLTLVCTPAGFGKTTLLADWASAARLPVAWVSLDPDDNDPVRFWRYVVAALDRACEGLGDQLLPMLSSPGAMSTQGLVTTLINAIEDQDNEIVLVLDDYHLVESSLVHDSMAFFLSRIPRRLHLAVASRTDPPLPLARLRARDQLAELRADQLRFTTAEAAGFLQQVSQLSLAPEVIATLDARTEGWAVGLQLAALSLRERPDPESFLDAFTGSHRYVLDYLSEEVLARQSESVRAFLLHSSVLDRMTGPLCDAVNGGANGQQTLEELERANLFVVPLDEQRRWYRFHHLFTDVLRAQLLRLVPASGVVDLHRRAGEWYERNGLIADAIKHASEAGDPSWAARLVEQHLNETLRRGETGVVARWITLLPEHAVRDRPALCLAQGMLEFHAGHLGTAVRCLEYADQAVRRGRSQQALQFPTDGGMVSKLPAAIAILHAQLSAVRGDVKKMADFARTAIEHTTEDERGPRIWAQILLASAGWMSGRLADAEVEFAEILAEARAAPDAYPTMATCFPLGRVRHARGKLDAALQTYDDGLRFATEGGSEPNLYHAAESHLGMGQVWYERDELDRARYHITTGIEFGRQVVDLTTPLLGLITLAWVRRAEGDWDGALAAIDEACQLRSRDVVSMWNPAPSEQARLLLIQGRIDEVVRWTRERQLGLDDTLIYARERDYLVLVRALLAQGFADDALRLLQRLDELAESQGRVQSLIQIRTLRSLAFHAAGDLPHALASLAEALALARPQGFIRVFADEGEPLRMLLGRLLSQRPFGRAASTSSPELRVQVSRILQAFEPRNAIGKKPAAPPGLIAGLTERELEVLRLIADGRRNREIADDLVVTLETVKKHTSHILSKLGASSRTHAVARARELDLIP